MGAKDTNTAVFDRRGFRPVRVDVFRPGRIGWPCAAGAGRSGTRSITVTPGCLYFEEPESRKAHVATDPENLAWTVAIGGGWIL